MYRFFLGYAFLCGQAPKREGPNMKVVKVFNNNVVLIENDNNVEEIVAGSGIGSVFERETP